MRIGDYELVKTCGACPEQYDVFKDGEQAAYLRLRHGEFRAEVPDCGGKEVYYSEAMNGDGIFDDHERDHFLNEAIKAVAEQST